MRITTLAFATLLFAPFAVPQAAHASTNCAKSGTAAAAVAVKLQQLGYVVQCGTVTLNVAGPTSCTNQVGGDNPNGCYGLYSLPTRAGGAGSTSIQLDDDEAVLTLGTMPPPVAYYGYNTVVNSRTDPTVTPPAQVLLAAPFGPAMNQRNVNPASRAAAGGGTYQIFGQTTAIVSTANRITQKDVMTALGYVYGAATAQNLTYVEKLPVDLINLGSSGSADRLQIDFRVTPFTSAPGVFDPAAIQYLLSLPIQILRISPAVPRTHVAAATYTSASDPLPPTKVVAGQSYEQLLLARKGISAPSLALKAIAKTVIADRAAKGETLASTFSFTANTYLQGRLCLAAFQAALAQAQQAGTALKTTSQMNCEGISPDADYPSPSGQLIFAAGGEAVVVGVNHAALGSASFSNVGVQQPAQYAYGLDSGNLSGTAGPYFGSLPAAALADFFVVRLNERCKLGSASCMKVPSGTNIYLAERIYLSPPTATMPDYTDIVPSILLIFNPPSATVSSGD